MKLIKLTKGQFAKVSDHRFEELSKHKWHAVIHHSGSYYAARNENANPNGKPWKNSYIRMHRQILGLVKGDNRQGEHRDGDALNNQDDNLRIATNSQNAMNRKPIMSNNTSGHKGVYFRKDATSNPWGAFVKINGKMISLGFRATKEEAIALRIAGEQKYYGEYARRG